jgi:hypothetical protein
MDSGSPPDTPQIAADPAPVAPFDVRVERLRQKLAEGRCGVKPPALIAAQLVQTAILMTRAADASADPNLPANDLVRLQNCARRAQRDLDKMLTALDRARPRSTPLLSELLGA